MQVTMPSSSFPQTTNRLGRPRQKEMAMPITYNHQFTLSNVFTRVRVSNMFNDDDRVATYKWGNTSKLDNGLVLVTFDSQWHKGVRTDINEIDWVEYESVFAPLVRVAPSGIASATNLESFVASKTDEVVRKFQGPANHDFGGHERGSLPDEAKALRRAEIFLAGRNHIFPDYGQKIYLDRAVDLLTGRFQ